MTWLDRIPLQPLLVIGLILGLSPFYPEPHLWEKLKMLSEGALTAPLDIFDLALHGLPVLLVTAKLGREAGLKLRDRGQ
ncbi:MAG: RND transporter [Pseudomonadota bacterium]